MSERAALESHLRHHPEDWPSWLVYADWLTDAGDARGQLIALAHRLEIERLSKHERRNLQQQASLLTQEYQREWLSRSTIPKEAELEWRHGFVVGVSLPWDDHALRRLAEIQAHPDTHFLTRLGLCDSEFEAKRVLALASSGCLRTFTRLELYNNELGPKGAHALTSSETLCALTYLGLFHSHLGDEGARILATSEGLHALIELDLSNNKLGDEGARILATSEGLRALTQLNLCANDIGPEGARVLASSEALRHCRVLR